MAIGQSLAYARARSSKIGQSKTLTRKGNLEFIIRAIQKVLIKATVSNSESLMEQLTRLQVTLCSTGTRLSTPNHQHWYKQHKVQV